MRRRHPAPGRPGPWHGLRGHAARGSVLAGGVLMAVTLLSGCGTPSAGAFSDDFNTRCERAQQTIAKLDPPTSGVRAVSYAIDRYTSLERLISQADVASLPAGQADDLKRAWLVPARRSMQGATDDLSRLREAVREGAPDIADRFAVAARIGTDGVDLDVLRAHHLPACATLFDPARAPRYQPG